jgi:hypothetical protein
MARENTYEVEVEAVVRRPGRRETERTIRVTLRVQAFTPEAAELIGRSEIGAYLQPWSRINGASATMIECGGCAMCDPAIRAEED